MTSALTEHQITVTGLWQNLKSHSKTITKYGIKWMDRLIGNRHSLSEHQDIYKYMSSQLLGQQKHPILIADWPMIPGNEIFQLLRIFIPMGGCLLTIYEDCFEEKKLNNTEVHNAFLDELEIILPKGCQPVIFLMPFIKYLGSRALRQKVGTGLDDFEVMSSCHSMVNGVICFNILHLSAMIIWRYIWYFYQLTAICWWLTTYPINLLVIWMAAYWKLNLEIIDTSNSCFSPR